jgi:hypothetical protein
MTPEGEIQTRVLKSQKAQKRAHLILDVLNGTPSFDAANGKAVAVGEAGYDSGLEFEGTDEGFVDAVWLGEVNDGNVSVCCANNEELILGVHRICSLRQRHRRNRLWGCNH